ncbi:MAG: cell wall hydrolase [Lachnospiraceae bacterium]|nr:cell wall hydrolase [Lachnospiraceae bacterium]
MYKKYATLFLIYNMVLFLAWACVQGIGINKKVVEAFTIGGERKEELQVTGFIGVTQEKISEERVLTANVMTKTRKIKVTQSEYDNLLRLVEAEAGGEDLIGKMLVANVVLNRVEDKHFPNSINEVIFQSNNGVAQFSPISDGRFYSVKVSDETIEAVNLVLQGEDNSQGALYFAARKSANENKMRWFDENLQWIFAHGGHEFFF